MGQGKDDFAGIDNRDWTAMLVTQLNILDSGKAEHIQELKSLGVQEVVVGDMTDQQIRLI